MTRRSMIWLAAAVVFTVVNLGGAVFAAVQGELLHAGIHAGLLLLAWRLARGRSARAIRRAEGSVIAVQPGELTDRLTHLEQSLDAVAIEVERIGEGQRFMTRFFTEKGIPRGSGTGTA